MDEFEGHRQKGKSEEQTEQASLFDHVQGLEDSNIQLASATKHQGNSYDGLNDPLQNTAAQTHIKSMVIAISLPM